LSSPATSKDISPFDRVLSLSKDTATKEEIGFYNFFRLWTLALKDGGLSELQACRPSHTSCRLSWDESQRMATSKSKKENENLFVFKFLFFPTPQKTRTIRSGKKDRTDEEVVKGIELGKETLRDYVHLSFVFSAF
jgi:hypothetical protein